MPRIVALVTGPQGHHAAVSVGVLAQLAQPEHCAYRDFDVGTVDFAGAVFSGGEVRFVGAVFSGSTVSFGTARFSGSTVDFAIAQFSAGQVDFGSARFSGSTVDFSRAARWAHPPVFSWDGEPPPGVALPTHPPGETQGNL